MSRCVIFGAGESPTRIDILDDDYIICADGGIEIARRFSITNFIAIGDFDSFEGEVSRDYIKLPAEKDDTDLIAAINLGLKKGYSDFILYGCLGGRLDHTFANIQTLSYLNSKNANGILLSDDCKVILLDSGEVVVENDNNYKYISLFAFSDIARGVTIECLKYEVNNLDFTSNLPLGVSNEFINKTGKISVLEGKVIIIFTK